MADLNIETSLRAAVEVAKNLREKFDPDIRGQTDLIVNLFGLPAHANNYLAEAIMGSVSIEQTMADLNGE